MMTHENYLYQIDVSYISRDQAESSGYLKGLINVETFQTSVFNFWKLLLDTVIEAQQTMLKMFMKQLQTFWVLFLILQFLMLSFNEAAEVDSPAGHVGDAVSDTGKGLGKAIGHL